METKFTNVTGLIGKGTKIHEFASVHDNAVVGENCKIQSYSYICDGVTLKNNVFVGPHVCFSNDRDFSEPFTITPTLVKTGAKIGANSTILAGVIIGKNAIIGMGSVILRDVKDGEKVYGVVK